MWLREKYAVLMRSRACVCGFWQPWDSGGTRVFVVVVAHSGGGDVRMMMRRATAAPERAPI